MKGYDDHILLLREENQKLAYALGKELAIIDLNYLFERETLTGTVTRMKSLIDHIKRSFKKESSKDIIEWIEREIEELTNN